MLQRNFTIIYASTITQCCRDIALDGIRSVLIGGFDRIPRPCVQADAERVLSHSLLMAEEQVGVDFPSKDPNTSFLCCLLEHVAVFLVRFAQWLMHSAVNGNHATGANSTPRARASEKNNCALCCMQLACKFEFVAAAAWCLRSP